MNYYEILGIDPSASQDEIKKAYRKLSLQMHPDRNPNPDAVEKYKLVNVAYEILGNPTDRRRYDMETCSTGPGLDEMSQMFSQMFGPPGNGGIKVFTAGNRHHPGMDVPIDISELFNIINGMSGNMHGMPSPIHRPPPVAHNIHIGMDMVLSGGTIPVRIERWVLENTGVRTQETETLYVDIPKGIDDNELIVIRDKGHVVSDDVKGDVKITVHIKNDTGFVRNGLDLVYTHTISLKESLIGFKFNLPYLNGKEYVINNTSGKVISPNQTTTIPNMGLTRNGHIGSLKIIFLVEFPKSLTEEQIEQLSHIL